MRTERVRTQKRFRKRTSSTVWFGEARISQEELKDFIEESTDKLFTGQRLDSTGLYYYNARYYDPTIGRFISADSLVPSPFNPQALNRYTYVLNNPLKYNDPSGHLVNGDQITIGDETYTVCIDENGYKLIASDGSTTGNYTSREALLEACGDQAWTLGETNCNSEVDYYIWSGWGYDKYKAYNSSLGILIKSSEEWFMWDSHNDFNRGDVFFSVNDPKNSDWEDTFNAYIWNSGSRYIPWKGTDSIRRLADSIQTVSDGGVSFDTLYIGFIYFGFTPVQAFRGAVALTVGLLYGPEALYRLADTIDNLW